MLNQKSVFTNEVFIYRVFVDPMHNSSDLILNYLPGDDIKRINRFMFESDRITHTITRFCLRTVLSRILLIEPENISFSYNEYGKPFITPEHNPEDIRFNISHSDNMVLIALARGIDVGIDIEKIKDIDTVNGLIKDYFSPGEIEQFSSLPPDARQKAFFSAWTRKEAYIKAMGTGLSYPLKKFSVSVDPLKGAELLYDENNDCKSWTLKDIIVPEGYAAAAAVHGTGLEFRHYHISLQEQGLINISPITS